MGRGRRGGKKDGKKDDKNGGGKAKNENAWKGNKVVFKNAVGDSHTLTLKGSAKKPKLTLKSEEGELAPKIAKEASEPETEKDEKTHLDKAKKEAGAVEKLVKDETAKAKNERKPKTMEDVYKKLDEKSQKELKDVADELAKTDIDSETKLPETEIKKSVDGEGRAAMVEANPLSKAGPDGYPPKEDPKGWDYLAAKDNHAQYIIPDYHTNWVRAHLLNDNLHGPGVDWNLVPATRNTNLGQMEAKVESPAKIQVLNKKKVLWYKTEIADWHSGGPVKEPYDKYNTSFKFFPKKMNMSFGPLKMQNGKWDKAEDGKVFKQSFSLPAPPNMDHYPVPLDLLTSPEVINSYTSLPMAVSEAIYFLIDAEGEDSYIGLQNGLVKIFELGTMQGYKSDSQQQKSWLKSWKTRFQNVFNIGSKKVKY
ncbi:MAG: hypothetical protein IPP17_23830 [Bacteroidetes bacterium]|nr:hypothetical protein [Bacteroidota bacterium]